MSESRDQEPAAACNRPLPGLRLGLQVVLAALLVVAGVFGFRQLQKMARPPEKREAVTVVRTVRVLEVKRFDAEVLVNGHGTARAKYRIPLAAEVGGKVVSVSPKLKAGHRVAKDTLLVEIEADTYRNTRTQAEADEKRLEAQIRLLETKLGFDRERLEVSERAALLAKQEFERVAKLLQDDEVGTQAGVDVAEGAYLQRVRDVIMLKDAIAAHPSRVSELEASLEAARARRAQAELDISRTRISAPCNARVESAAVQVGQIVTVGRAGAGTELAVLSDLSVLEVPVALANDELRWLPISGVDAQGEYTFAQDAVVTVRWIRDAERGKWRGRISRIERFESETRTLTLVVEVIDNRAVAPGSGSLQLSEGMFCRVEVSGRPIKGVCRVPRALLRQDGTVPVCVDGKLVFRPVRVVRTQGDAALIDRGLEPDDLVVLTPITNPVAGMALRVEGERSGDAADRRGKGSAGR